MLKHENPNIEIINKDLWAVRFSLIPMIPQISVTHKEGTTANDLNELELTFTPDGIMILNKDHIASEMDVDGIMAAWTESFAEQLAVSAEGVHE